MARRQRISGSGIYLLHVDAAGNVTSVDVAKSAGSPILDDAAIRSFKKFKFKPGTAASLYVSIQIESKRISFLRSESLRQFSEQNIVAPTGAGTHSAECHPEKGGEGA